jgi:hypothetical protein
MKKLIPAVIIIIFLSSCGSSRYVNSGGGGCGAWHPRKFENDRAWKRNYNWVNNPRSGRYRSGF